MAWTAKQRKAHGAKIKAAWEAKRKLKEIAVLGEKIGALPSDDRYVVIHPKSPLLPVVEDIVNHPAHYTFGKYEVADVADDWYATEPHLWNANKYMARWNKKGDPIENLEKAVWYLQRKISQLKEKQNGQG